MEDNKKPADNPIDNKPDETATDVPAAGEQVQPDSPPSAPAPAKPTKVTVKSEDSDDPSENKTPAQPPADEQPVDTGDESGNDTSKESAAATTDGIKPAQSAPSTESKPPAPVEEKSSEANTRDTSTELPERQSPPADEKPVGGNGDNQKQTAVKKAGSHPPLAVIITVLVAIILVGLGYVAYRANQNETADGNQEQAEQQQPETIPADEQSAEELDNELDQLEQDLDDIESQLESDDLSDEALGI